MREKHMGTEEKHDYQVDLVGNLITSIYEALEEDQSDMRRTTRLAQIRAAIGKSLHPYFTLGVVAEALGMHRDTVCLHNKNHEENIVKWEGYEETLLISSAIIGSQMEKETRLTNIDILTKRISRLTKARNILKKNKS
tara:strand:- start:1242 stop:1655 length:414 start_codon:yes stop_codon:yes gene_type:complete